jgi:hypothetical protein
MSDQCGSDECSIGLGIPSPGCPKQVCQGGWRYWRRRWYR